MLYQKTDTKRALNKNLLRFSIRTYIYFLQTSLKRKAVNPLCYTHLLQNVLNGEKRLFGRMQEALVVDPI